MDGIRETELGEHLGSLLISQPLREIGRLAFLIALPNSGDETSLSGISFILRNYLRTVTYPRFLLYIYNISQKDFGEKQ